MPSFSIKDVPDPLAEQLRQRAARHHRSIQGELMAILQEAINTPDVIPQHVRIVGRDNLLERLDAIVADNSAWGAAPLLSRSEANDRALSRTTGREQHG